MEQQWLRTKVTVEVEVTHQFPGDGKNIVLSRLSMSSAPAIKSVRIVKEEAVEGINHR